MWRERGRFSPQKDQTGRKRQTKSDRALGPQNDSEGEKRPAMERERSCCRGENVIKYPSSWENALASAGLGNGFIPVLPQGGRNRVYRYSRAGAHPRVASLGLRPIYLQPPPYGFTLIRPSVRTGAPSPWKGEGWAGGPVCRPYGVYRSRPSFFVGAGHWPARRCTRRAESWFRPVSLALAGQFTFSRREEGSFRSGRLIAALQSGWQPAPSSASHSLGTLPPRGRLSGDRKGRPYGGYGSSSIFLVGAGPRPARQDSYRERWLGKPRRRYWTAPAAFFAPPGPSGPAGIQTDHSDFARRKRCTAYQEVVPRNGVRGKRPMGLGGA